MTEKTTTTKTTTETTTKITYDNIPFENEDTLNRYLLYKYLVKEYIASGATQAQAQEATEQLILKYKDHLFDYHGLAYSLGSRNLEFFSLYFLQSVFIGEGKAPIAPIHSTLWKEVQDTILDKTQVQQLEYTVCRGIGKSTFLTLCTSIWCAVYNYKSYILIASAIGDTASTFIRNIKLVLQDNKKIENAFGKLYDPVKFINNTEQIELSNKVMLQSISASSTLRGKSYGNKRVELLCLDDYQKDDETQTQDARYKKCKRFNDDVKYAMQKDNATILAVGTIQNPDDFYSRLSKLPTWKYRSEKGVLVDDVDELFNSGSWGEFKTLLFDLSDEFRLDTAKEFYIQHRNLMQYPLLWQSYWDCLDFALSYYENPVSFKQEVQGDTTSIGERRFKTIVTESPEDIESHSFTKTMLCIDPASSTSASADFSAFVVGSESDSSIKYIRKGEILKLDFDDYIDHVIKLLLAYEDITHIYIEKNLYMATDVLRLKEKFKQIPSLANRDFEFSNEMQRKNKIDKIETIVGDVNMGRVIFNEEDIDAIEQLKEYQGAKSQHDDFADCVAEFCQRVIDINVIHRLQFMDIRKLFRR